MGLLYLRDVTTLRLDPEACVGCGDCVTVCPREVLELRGGVAAVRDRDACIECGACALNCAAGALTVRAGVGCATGIINGLLGRGGDCCCVPGEDDGRGDTNKAAVPPGRGSCC
jgi:NAD-dependent dihydropyrimidine dehydrogenase PreA subunit